MHAFAVDGWYGTSHGAGDPPSGQRHAASVKRVEVGTAGQGSSEQVLL